MFDFYFEMSFTVSDLIVRVAAVLQYQIIMVKRFNPAVCEFLLLYFRIYGSHRSRVEERLLR